MKKILMVALVVVLISVCIGAFADEPQINQNVVKHLNETVPKVLILTGAAVIVVVVVRGFIIGISSERVETK